MKNYHRGPMSVIHHPNFWTNQVLIIAQNNVALLGDACHPSLPYQAQGAAMAVEDGAIIANLLGQYQSAKSRLQLHPSLPETLKAYESLQKSRTTTLTLGSIANQRMYHLSDGPEQAERDRILKQAKFEELPDEMSEPFIWIDIRYQKAVLARDAVGDAKAKWDEIMAGISQ